jgi:hypothetical protein
MRYMRKMMQGSLERKLLVIHILHCNGSGLKISTELPNANDIMRTPFVAPQNLSTLPWTSKDLCNIPSPSKVSSIMQMEQSYTSLIPQPYAPIFEDITITPCYDLVEESYVFSSKLQNSNYPTEPTDEMRALCQSPRR